MTIRKKLVISHLCMIAIPILLAVIVGAGVFYAYGSRFWDSPEEMLDDLNLSDAADWTVYECVDQYCYGAEYADDEYERDAALLAYGRGSDEIWSYLTESLAAMDYQVQVVVDGTTVTDNLTQSEKDAIVRRIIEGHGGSIRAYNDKGLVMEIVLPLADIDVSKMPNE